MFESALILWGTAVIILLVRIHQSNRQAVAWTRHVHERLVDQLTFLLFRTPDPTEDDQRRRMGGIMRYVAFDAFDELADQARVQQMVEGHPMVAFVWDVARDAYRDAQEVTLSFGKFADLTQEKQDKLRDEFWYFFARGLKLKLTGRAWLFEQDIDQEKHDWRTGEMFTQAGDVLLEATGLHPEFVVSAYRVRVVEKDGDQTGRPAGEFRSRSGAEAVAVRLSHKTRIIERREDGMWAVTWDGRTSDAI